MAITPLPDAPSRADPSTFADKGDAFLGALPQFQQELNATASAFALSVSASSTTSLTIGTGSQSLTVQTDKGFLAGMPVKIANTPAPGNYMLGSVTSYDSGTGALVVDATSVGGSGTLAVWSVYPTVPVSFDAQTYTDLRLDGKITEEVYALSGTAIDPANGSIQTKTLAGSTTFTESLADGQAVVLILTPAGNTVVWPTIDWLGDAAPDLTGVTTAHIVLYRVAGTLYGTLAGTTT